MIRKALAVGMTALLLSACVLEAKPPLFSESDGVPVLGGKAIAYDGYELKDGTWTKSNGNDPPLEFAPAGNHYIVAERGKSADSAVALFVPLKDGWLALQLNEADKPAIYSLAKLEGQSLLVAPLMCSDLKSLDVAKDSIAFDGSDCTAKDAKDARSFLQSLASAVPPPKMKLVPVP